MEIASAIKPRVIFLENVKNFRSHDKGRTYKTVTSFLVDNGYHFKDAILNSTEHGNIPQNRERFFLVASQDNVLIESFVFPEKISLTNTIHDCLIYDKVPDRFFIPLTLLYV